MAKNNKPVMTIDKWGHKRWTLAGSLHREDGPAIEYVNGDKTWYLYGRLHRDGGPAIEWKNDHKSWYKNGYAHRLDGPAIEYSYGPKSWWVDGEHIKCSTQEEFERLMRLKAFW